MTSISFFRGTCQTVSLYFWFMKVQRKLNKNKISVYRFDGTTKQLFKCTLHF